MKRFLSMLIAMVMILGMLPARAYAEDFDTENFVGLVLTVADSSYTVELYKGITSQKTLLTPAYTEDNAYYYTLTASGSYCYFVKSSSASHYSVRQNFNLSSQQIKTKIVWDVTPATRTTTGWDHKEVWSYTDEVMASAFPSSPELWPDYAELFKVPALTIPRTDHQMTTQTEMMDYITALDGEKDNMYVFNLGKSGGPSDKQLDIPVVFFSTTDLSEAATWEDAAALLHANGKLTALYQAQVHGNEPAAGEAALGMLKAFDGSYGENLLNNMNICVVPRLNVYGAYKAQRYVYVDGKDVDPNRDFVKLDSQEVLLRTQLFLALEPEVYFDNHEYQLRVTNTNVAMHDVKLNSVYTTKSTEAFRELSLTLAYEAFGRAEENNLGYGWYDDSVNGYNASVGTTNVAMRGCLSFLTETNGIYGGNQQLERRMMSHISVVTGILDYVNANTAAVQKVVDDQRRDIVERGKTYEDSDTVVLKTGSTDRPDLYIAGKQVAASSGKITSTTFTSKSFDVAKLSRTAPTAYVIPAGEAWAETAIENLRLNGVTVQKIPSAAVVQLQQYTGTTSAAALTEEKAVSFPNGAYVMTMNQVNSYILAVRMEPDMSDGSSNTVTFAQEGVIPATNNTFPIYRYIHDLNSDDFIDYTLAPAAPTGLAAQGATVIGGTGKITGLDATKSYEYRPETAEEYTPVAAGATEIADLPLGNYLVRYCGTQNDYPSADAKIAVNYALTQYAVYVDSASGKSTNDAYTPDTAASTYSIAKGQLDLIMEHAPAGATGEIHLIGTYNMTKSSSGYLSLQKHDYPLLITGGTLIFKDSTNSQKFLRMGGDTTFDHITLQVGSDSNAYYLCGEGYKLTIGEHVTTPAYNGSRYFNIMGGVGEYNNNYYAAQTDVTVLSGTWRYVFAGGYVSSVSGNAKLTASNCTVSRIGGSHNGKLNGDLYMELDNIKISDNAIYCGNQQKNNVAGDVTLVLGENIGAAKVFAGSSLDGNIGGTVTVVADGVDLTKTTVYGKPNNTTGTIGGLALVLNNGQLAKVAGSFITRDGVSVTLGCNQTEMVTVPYDINLELNGHSISGMTTNGNRVMVSDGATDDFDVADGIYGTVPAGSDMLAADGYLPVTVNGKTSFHKYEIGLSELVVNTDKVGITYKANFSADQIVRDQIAEFGVAVSAYEAPDLNSILQDHSNAIHVAMPGSQFTTGSTVKSVYVKGILAENLSDQKNTSRAEVQVYGNCYIALKDGRMLISDVHNQSLMTAMQYMNSDAIWNTYLTDADKQKLADFCKTWETVMQDWEEIDKIKELAGLGG